MDKYVKPQREERELSLLNLLFEANHDCVGRKKGISSEKRLLEYFRERLPSITL